MRARVRRSAIGAWRSTAAGVAGALLLVTAASGCGGDGDADGGAGDGGTDRPRRATAHELALLDRAEETLVARCMTRHGFRYHRTPPPAPDALRDFPYVVDDTGWARRHGYGGDLLRAAERERTHHPAAAYVRGLAPERRRAYTATLYGGDGPALEVTVPTGGEIRQSRTGCLAEAQGRLYGDFREWFRVDTLASNLPDHGEALRRTPDFRAAVDQWAGCMREAGHPYDSPDELQRRLPALTEGADAERAHRTEVRLATAEAKCARGTPLADTVRRLARKLALRDRERYGAEIAARDRMRLAALERAKDLVGTGRAADAKERTGPH